MTFECYRATKTRDIWSPSPQKVERPLHFVRHKGRVFNVVGSKDGLLCCEAINNHSKRKVLHELDLD